MQYRRLGNTGLRVSAVGIGGWQTFGETLDQAGTRLVLRAAADHGINLIDMADSYALGGAERAVGTCMGEFRRSDLVLSSKVFGPMSQAPNDRGLSRKHIMESIDRTLANLRTDYLDLYFCHHEDPQVPIEETARAMGDLVRAGKILYWGTSNWRQGPVAAAHAAAARLRLQPPAVEQPGYNLLERGIERWLLPTTLRLGMGLITWRPLARGLLTGKFTGFSSAGAAADGRFTKEHIAANAARIQRLCEIAQRAGVLPAQLAIAWILQRPFIAAVITGATSPEQIIQSAAAADLSLPAPIFAELSRLFPRPALRAGDVARLARLALRPHDLRRLLQGG